jgi:hypothetical protein
MIQYDKDGATIFYIDDKGNKISAVPFEGQRYSDLLGIMDTQHSAVTENARAKAAYSLSVSNAQISVDAGRPAPPLPDKPREQNVSDTGVVTYAAFVPPLPDLVYPVTVPSTGQIKVPTVDTQAIMYAMVTAIYRKMFPAG